MIKKMTVSELLDKKEEQVIRRFQKLRNKIKKNDKKVEIIVEKQFKIAKSILGHRLSMEKTHNSMYNFFFNYGSGQGSYIHSSEECNINMKFKFTPSYSLSHFEDLVELNEKEFKLSELANILIRWVEIMIKKELEEK